MKKTIYLPIDTTLYFTVKCNLLIKKLDTLTFNIAVFEKGLLKNISGQTIDLVLKKSDGTNIQKTITDINSNVATITLDSQATSCSGAVEGELVFTDSNGQSFTNTFTYNVRNTLATDIVIKSEDSIKTIEDIRILTAKYKEAIEQIGDSTVAAEALVNIQNYINTNLPDLKNNNSLAASNISILGSKNTIASENIDDLNVLNDTAEEKLQEFREFDTSNIVTTLRDHGSQLNDNANEINNIKIDVDKKANFETVTSLKNKVDSFQISQDLSPTKDLEVVGIRSNYSGEVFENASNRVDEIERQQKELEQITKEIVPSNNIFIDNLVDLDTITDTIENENYYSNNITTRMGFLSSVELKTNATEILIKAITLDKETGTIDVKHDYGTFDVPDNKIVEINDESYLISAGEYIIIAQINGTVYYKLGNENCIAVNVNDMSYSPSGGNVTIAYNVKINPPKRKFYEPVTIRTGWEGKKWIAYGDSITYGYNLSDVKYAYPYITAKDLEMNVIDRGKSASGFSTTEGSNLLFYKLLENYTADSDVDLVTVALGTNDFGLANKYGRPFGIYTDNTDATFCGCVKLAFDKLVQMYPKAVIIIILPLARPDMLTANSYNMKLPDYSEAIEYIAHRYYSFPCLNMTKESRMNINSSAFCAEFLPDGLHPSISGHEKYMKPKIKKFIIENSLQ